MPWFQAFVSDELVAFSKAFSIGRLARTWMIYTIPKYAVQIYLVGVYALRVNGPQRVPGWV